MSIVGDLIENVVGGALREVLRKTLGATGKRRRRRTRAAKTNPATVPLRKMEKLLKPKAKRQVSRRRTVRARSQAKRRPA